MVKRTLGKLKLNMEASECFASSFTRDVSVSVFTRCHSFTSVFPIFPFNMCCANLSCKQTSNVLPQSDAALLDGE